MTRRNLAIVAATILAMLDVAPAASSQVTNTANMSVAPDAAAMIAYRQYVTTQAQTLAAMTRVLARVIRQGDVAAAQSFYPSAHRYFARIEPVARLLRDLHDRMDARADTYGKREVDPSFSGFHRIEYGLFAKQSTAGLADEADRLAADASSLQSRLAHLDLSPAVLTDASAQLAGEVAEKGLDGDAERYSKTDLWDVEADMEGVHEVVALLRSQVAEPNGTMLTTTEGRFAEIDGLLDKQKDGCGFKAFDELSRDDRAALRVPVAAIAEALSRLRGVTAME